MTYGYLIVLRGYLRGLNGAGAECCGQFVLGEIHPPVSETFDIVMHMVEKALGGTGDSDCQRETQQPYPA